MTATSDITIVPDADQFQRDCQRLNTARLERYFYVEPIDAQMLAFSREKGINKIILYSHTKLQPALHLYRKFGFVEIPVDDSV